MRIALARRTKQINSELYRPLPLTDERTGPQSVDRLDVHRIGQGVAMAIIPWVVLGLIADLIAGSFLNESGEGIELDIVLAIVGAVTGGFLCSLLGDAAGNEFNNHDTIVAVSGAIVAL